MNKNRKIHIVFIFFIILIVATSVTKYMQNDTYFTIATGNQIMENGYDNLDHLTWHEGLEFYKLRWAFDVVIAMIFNNFNFTGIYIFTIIMACAIGITLFEILIKQKNNIIVAFIITILSVLFLAKGEFFTARGQIISYLLLLIELFIIEQLIENKKPKNYIFLFIISLLIVNFHASVWYMTIILILPYLAEAIIQKFLKNKEISRNIEIKTLIIAIISLIIGSICSPISTYVYTYMFKVVGGISSQFISELQITNIVQELGVMTWLGIFIILTIGTKTKIKLSDILMFLGLTFMAILAKRNIAYLYIIGSISIARLITTFINKYDDEDLLNKAIIKLQTKKYIAIMSIVVTLVCVTNYLDKIEQEYIDKSMYPVEAVNYIKENLDYKNLKVYNHFDFGSYMELQGIKAFIDSRSEIYTKEFNNTDILEDWYHVEFIKDKHYEDLFEKYDIDYTLLSNEDTVNVYLSRDSNYNKLYEDKYFSIYMKK